MSKTGNNIDTIPHWNALRNETKFYRLHDFGMALPGIRLQLEKDLSIPELTAKKGIGSRSKFNGTYQHQNWK